jgi:hypothetical protein
LIEHGDADGLPPCEKNQSFDAQEFPHGPNRCQFIFGGIIEKNQTIQGPTLTQVGQDANVQISTLVGKITFLVPMVAFQNHDHNAGDKFQQDVLQDTKFAFDKKGTRPMDAFEGATVIDIVAACGGGWMLGM